MTSLITWWLTIQLFGLAALPLTAWVMRWLPGQGYAFSKGIGLLLVSYVLWAGAITGILVNDLGGIWFALLLLAGISARVAFSNGWQAGAARLKAFWRSNRTQILAVEALFLLTFAGWALVRAYAPDKILPAGGEKYMEIAFLNGVLNSPAFPPLDPWLSGFAISYYYFGYVMMAIMTRLTGVAPGIGFDLYDALLFALTAISAYGITSSLVAAAGGKQRAGNLTGLLGALFVGGMGNLQGLLEGLYSSSALPDAFWKWLDLPDLAGSAQSGSFYPGDGWWWWRASRVLHDLDLFYQPAAYQPIDEFPFFSFLLGDNHPHKLALPFVLLCVGLALNLLLKTAHAGQPTAHQDGQTPEFLTRVRLKRGEIFFYAFYALALGSLGFLNTWDLPIYLVVITLAYAVGKYFSGARLDLAILVRTLALGAALGASAVLLYLFFYLGFSSQAGGILPYIFPPTRLAQYLVMFGPFIAILAVFLILAAWRTGRTKVGTRFPWQNVLRAWGWTASIIFGLYLLILLAGVILLRISSGQATQVLQSWFRGLDLSTVLGKVLLSRLANPWLFLLLSVMLALAAIAFLGSRPATDEPEEKDSDRALSPATSFALLLAFAGIGLTFSVEFFYLRDMFGMRMNTIFKFYFQGWVLLACASAYAVWWVARFTRRAPRAIFLGAAAILTAAGLVYPVMAVRSRTESFSQAPRLDASASIAGEYAQHWAAQPDDWRAAQWINENIRPQSGAVPILLEAPGGGYQNNGRISAFTGLPTLLGWTNHEGQWRGSYDEINRRAPDIQAIYTTPSEEEALDLLHKWQVSYVILGNAEQQYIESTCRKPETSCSPERALAKFDRFLTRIYSQQSITIYSVPK